jgi:hypothetical protein
MKLAEYKFYEFRTVSFNIITQYKPKNAPFLKNIYFNILMSSARFEPEGSSSGRRLYIQLWYGIVCCIMHRYKQSGG